MKFHLKGLSIALQRENIEIPLQEVNYFWGQMGAGKSSIAKLIDYCLGGDIKLSPALQSEFVSAKIALEISIGDLTIERVRESDRVVACWGEGDDAHQLSLPSRKAAGEVIPGTGVEVLSDLLFWLSGIRPPHVRRSKVKEDSETGRLSIRDLLWYCYLDQDDIDSSFFHLEEKAPFYKRFKSRDVIRYIIGFYSERVAEIEAELDELRGKRLAFASSIASLTKSLKAVGVESEEHLQKKIIDFQDRAQKISLQIEIERNASSEDRTTRHAADELREKAKNLGIEIAKTDEAIADLFQIQDRDRRQLNEIETLIIKFQRSLTAKSVLVGVAFESCPRCVQPLQGTREGHCPVCGQPENIQTMDPSEIALVNRDAKIRIAELQEVICKHEESLFRLKREREEFAVAKSRTERERNEALERYDSAFLSTIISKERERASIIQEIENLTGMLRLPQMVKDEESKLADIAAREEHLKAEYKLAKEEAESDDKALQLLKDLFLDCLVRSEVPGLTRKDIVEFPSSLYPEIYSPNPEDKSVLTFETLSSGGKKTLFKSCFAIAIHRLATRINATLPEMLIIDSPMKNISERENRSQFRAFYKMVYELKKNELSTTQLLLFDKEFFPPDHSFNLSILERHMRPEDPKNPPLIPYYRGK